MTCIHVTGASGAFFFHLVGYKTFRKQCGHSIYF